MAEMELMDRSDSVGLLARRKLQLIAFAFLDRAHAVRSPARRNALSSKVKQTGATSRPCRDTATPSLSSVSLDVVFGHHPAAALMSLARSSRGLRFRLVLCRVVY